MIRVRFFGVLVMIGGVLLTQNLAMKPKAAVTDPSMIKILKKGGW